jgi:RimJ/RimL family protein N-acetyltransferase
LTAIAIDDGKDSNHFETHEVHSRPVQKLREPSSIYNGIGAIAYDVVDHPMGAPLSITVRRAKASDLDGFEANVQSVADEGRYIWTERVTERERAMHRSLFKDRGCLALVAEVRRGKERRLVGSLTMTRYGQAVKKSQHVRVLGMLVIDGYREMGIGSRMMETALDWARKKRGVEKVVLGVFSNNRRALRLYEKFGFKVEGVRKDHYYIGGEREDEIDMALFVK